MLCPSPSVDQVPLSAENHIAPLSCNIPLTTKTAEMMATTMAALTLFVISISPPKNERTKKAPTEQEKVLEQRCFRLR